MILCEPAFLADSRSMSALAQSNGKVARPRSFMSDRQNYFPFDRFLIPDNCDEFFTSAQRGRIVRLVSCGLFNDILFNRLILRAFIWLII